MFTNSEIESKTGGGDKIRMKISKIAVKAWCRDGARSVFHQRRTATENKICQYDSALSFAAILNLY